MMGRRCSHSSPPPTPFCWPSPGPSLPLLPSATQPQEDLLSFHLICAAGFPASSSPSSSLFLPFILAHRLPAPLFPSWSCKQALAALHQPPALVALLFYDSSCDLHLPSFPCERAAAPCQPRTGSVPFCPVTGIALRGSEWRGP